MRNSLVLGHQYACSSALLADTSPVNAANWPIDGSFAIEYRFIGNGNSSYEITKKIVQYFYDVNMLNKWLKDKRDSLENMMSDFTMSFTVYRWSDGPQSLYSKTI